MIFCLFGCKLCVSMQGSERSSSTQPCYGKKIKFLLQPLNFFKISPPQPRAARSAMWPNLCPRPWCWVPPSSASTHSSFLPLNPRRKRCQEESTCPKDWSLCVVCKIIKMPSIFLYFDDASVCSVYKPPCLKQKLRVQTPGVPSSGVNFQPTFFPWDGENPVNTHLWAMQVWEPIFFFFSNSLASVTTLM